GRAPHAGPQQQQQQLQQSHHDVLGGGGGAGGNYLLAPAHLTEVPAVRGHRPRNSSASCGNYSAIANDGSLVVIGGMGAAAAGGGFLDQPHLSAAALTADLDPPSARLQRNVSLPGALREGGGHGQGRGFVSTPPPSSGAEGGGGYFTTVPTPPGGGRGGRGGGCSVEEAYNAEGDEMYFTPQHGTGGTPQHGKRGTGFSFPAGGGGAGSGGSIYVTPRSTPRHNEGGMSVDRGESRREAYAHLESSRERDGFEVEIERRQSGLTPLGGSFRGGGGGGAPPASTPAAAAAAATAAGPNHGAAGAAWPLDTGR
ncbi:unnamed protein product, partial [Ectocarpus sp. 6 AP-2014]